MTKSELIQQLQQIDGDPEVMVSTDEEGNGFNTVRDVEFGPTDSDGQPCHLDDAEEGCKRVIVIWP